MKEWVDWENGLLRRMGAGGELMADSSDPREIVSRAASVGIPIGALYMAGVTGFSAAGITSGLAFIGSYTGLTVLGLNPMTAGIAGLIIAGVTVKKVSDYAMGNSCREAKELRKRLEEFRTVQLGAATRLAGDIPRLEALLVDEPEDRSSRVLSEMRTALQGIEDSA